MIKKEVNEVLQAQGNHICKIFSNNRKIVIWGCGIIGSEVAPVIETYGLLNGFIDRDERKQKMQWNGFSIYAPEEYIKSGNDDYIIIAASEKNKREITDWLLDRGMKKGQDFEDAQYFLKNIFPYLSFYGFNKIYVEVSQICLTERCTLNCEKCAHGCNKVPMTQKDLTWDEIQNSADSFFKHVDFVKEFVLLGGEPFLSKDLSRAIQYIGEKYRSQIAIFSITTNGTIVPSDEIIGLCKRFDVTFRVSDYEHSIPKLAEAYKKFYEKTDGIKTIIWKTNKEDSWFDYGFGEVDNGTDTKTLCRVFQKCRTSCREVRTNRYYYCVMARSVSENVGYSIGLDEYFDLAKDFSPEDLFAFEMGYIENGYLSMCRYCRGSEAMNYTIPAAIQEPLRI